MGCTFPPLWEGGGTGGFPTLVFSAVVLQPLRVPVEIPFSIGIGVGRRWHSSAPRHQHCQRCSPILHSSSSARDVIFNVPTNYGHDLVMLVALCVYSACVLFLLATLRFSNPQSYAYWAILSSLYHSPRYSSKTSCNPLLSFNNFCLHFVSHHPLEFFIRSVAMAWPLIGELCLLLRCVAST